MGLCGFDNEYQERGHAVGVLELRNGAPNSKGTFFGWWGRGQKTYFRTNNTQREYEESP